MKTDRLRAARITIVDNGEIVWEARYVVCAIAASLMVLAFVVEHRLLGIRPSFWSVVWTILAAIHIARAIADHYDGPQHDCYLAAELNDLASMPREPGKVLK